MRRCVRCGSVDSGEELSEEDSKMSAADSEAEAMFLKGDDILSIYFIMHLEFLCAHV